MRRDDIPDHGEVVVVGGGTAALCAALSARAAGAGVLLLDQAPRTGRGGNSRHSRNLRIMHEHPSPLFPGRYDEADFWADLTVAAQGGQDETLARAVIRQSAEVPDWLSAHGVVFQTTGLPWSRKTAFFLGGGMAMINSLHATAARRGVVIRHQTEVTALSPDGTVSYRRPGGGGQVRAAALVVACGGYQANRAWLREEWGTAADSMVVRGTPHAGGAPLRALYALGAGRSGRPGTGHLVAVDARLDQPDGGIVTRIDGLDLGIVIDRDGRRFQDETAIGGPTRYAAWGRLIAARPGGLAFAVWDDGGMAAAPPPLMPPWRDGGLDDLAARIGVDPAVLRRSAADSGRIVRPPFHAVPVCPGITFTSQGVRVDRRCRICDGNGQPLPGLFAAGMIMAPAILGTGYLAGAALTIGVVSGRIAGEEAARHAVG